MAQEPPLGRGRRREHPRQAAAGLVQVARGATPLDHRLHRGGGHQEAVGAGGPARRRDRRARTIPARSRRENRRAAWVTRSWARRSARTPGSWRQSDPPGRSTRASSSTASCGCGQAPVVQDRDAQGHVEGPVREGQAGHVGGHDAAGRRGPGGAGCRANGSRSAPTTSAPLLGHPGPGGARAAAGVEHPARRGRGAGRAGPPAAPGWPRTTSGTSPPRPCGGTRRAPRFGRVLSGRATIVPPVTDRGATSERAYGSGRRAPRARPPGRGRRPPTGCRDGARPRPSGSMSPTERAIGPRLEGTRWMVTGGLGFIGSNLARALAAAGAHVRGRRRPRPHPRRRPPQPRRGHRRHRGGAWPTSATPRVGRRCWRAPTSCSTWPARSATSAP